MSALAFSAPTLSFFIFADTPLVRLHRAEIFEDFCRARSDYFDAFRHAVNYFASHLGVKKFLAKRASNNHRMPERTLVARHNDMLRGFARAKRRHQRADRCFGQKRMVHGVQQKRGAQGNVAQRTEKGTELPLAPSFVQNDARSARHFRTHHFGVASQDDNGPRKFAAVLDGNGQRRFAAKFCQRLGEWQSLRAARGQNDGNNLFGCLTRQVDARINDTRRKLQRRAIPAAQPPARRLPDISSTELSEKLVSPCHADSFALKCATCRVAWVLQAASKPRATCSTGNHRIDRVLTSILLSPRRFT